MPVPDNPYTLDEQRTVLWISRQTLETITQGQEAPFVDLETVTPALREERACFVTFRHIDTQELRGCTGTLVAQNPLALEVSIMTVQTALNDPRFQPVQAHETHDLHIEVSVLTPMEPLLYIDAFDLVKRIRPNIDGVTLVLGRHRATFLPQVWERVPDPEKFLSMLSRKMGLSPNAWRQHKMQVFTYQSIVIEESWNHPA
ncbi:MAG: AmmeMemoRadiSam system protein A [Chloroflexi bacterium]|nr:AmmeMemoRadiSam system protein A [Chloroflexota bacterium]